MTAVRYCVRPASPREHWFEIDCQLDHPDPQGQRFWLPSWIRGSYLVRDFAKHVIDVRAQDARGPLALERLDKRTLRVAPASGALTLRYRVYAFDVSVRKAYLDLSRGFFNGSALFYCPAGHERAGFALTIERPQDPDCGHWRVATTLRATQIDADGFGCYAAADYEELIDHPVEMGRFVRHDFDVDGIAHALVLSGRCEVDGDRIVRDLARICRVQRELFRQEPARGPEFAQYLFLTHVVASGYGGLEHRSSTALICARTDLPRPGETGVKPGYRAFLGLCSHEYFHLWNVKRITAQRLAESDLGAEAYTADLWHYEGVTSYYDDLFLLRAGIIEAPAYLDLVAENMTRIERTPGARIQTLADASFEAWVKYYQPDENSPNATVSYYVKGALVALCLDLMLRLHAHMTLDDVMRSAWQRWGRTGVPVPEGGLEALAQTVSGLDLRAFFDRALRSTEPLPLAELLAAFGVRAERRAARGSKDAGGRSAEDGPAPAWLGLQLRAQETRVAHVLAGSPAAQAGVHPGDQVVALDGLRVGAANWDSALARLVPGRRYPLHVFRDDELIELDIEPAQAPLDTWTLTLAEADGERLARRKAWLGV